MQKHPKIKPTLHQPIPQLKILPLPLIGSSQYKTPPYTHQFGFMANDSDSLSKYIVFETANCHRKTGMYIFCV